MAQYIDRVDLVFKMDWDNDIQKWTLTDEDLDEITTITDAAPVVHGRLTNIDKNEWYCDFGKCSVCGEENPTDAKYCLGCGARMDGE